MEELWIFEMVSTGALPTSSCTGGLHIYTEVGVEVEVEVEVERRDDGAPVVGGLERGWRDRRDCRAGDYRGAVEAEQRGV